MATKMNKRIARKTVEAKFELVKCEGRLFFTNNIKDAIKKSKKDTKVLTYKKRKLTLPFSFTSLGFLARAVSLK